MKAIRFQTMIGDDQLIRIPPDALVSPGQAEVIVLQPENLVARTAPKSAEPSKDADKTEQHLFDHLLRDVEELGVDDLPEDLAENHDHYIHGTPKRTHDA